MSRRNVFSTNRLCTGTTAHDMRCSPHQIRISMTKSIYRTAEGHAVVRAWCTQRLSTVDVIGHDIDTPLGPTRVTSVGDGADVVMLPGTNFSTATWLRLITVVGREHRATGVDLPGQPGLSTGHRPPRDAYGSWLREIIGTLGLDRPVIVGHSLGAYVALLAATGAPSIRGLVLVNPAGLIRLRVRPTVLATTLRWLARRDDHASAALLRRMAAPGADIAPDLTTWMTLVARHVRTSLAPPRLSPTVLADVRCPVRLVTGRHDPFLPAGRLADALRSIGGRTTATTVSTAGHLLPEETPHEVLTAIRKLIAEH
jgi:pimeloyl-ACP methyl ester carboxylesterase